MFAIVVATFLCFWIAWSPVNGHEEHLEVAQKQVTLKDVCKNRMVPLISVEEVQRLIKDLHRDVDADICVDKYRQAFYELEPIFITNEKLTICSEAKFEQIKDYHFRYVNPLVEDFKFGDDLNHIPKKIVFRPLDEKRIVHSTQLDEYNQEILIPIALQQFFKAYVLQISGLCKITLAQNIKQAWREMTDYDYELFESGILKSPSKEQMQSVGSPLSETASPESPSSEPSSPKSPSSPAPESPGRVAPDLMTESKFNYSLMFRDLVYMPELEGELDEGDTRRREETTLLDLRSKPELNKFMHACEKRFKPIYSKLVMPIVRLSKLGYEYVGKKIDRYSELLKSDSVLTWLLITMACEARGKIRLLGPDEDDMKTLAFNPVENFFVEGPLWIKGNEALRKAFNDLNGFRSKGMARVWYDIRLGARKFAAMIDPHQSAWYRKNQNTLSSALNTISVISNMASIGVTVAGAGG